jgi:hypothetical protein
MNRLHTNPWLTPKFVIIRLQIRGDIRTRKCSCRVWYHCGYDTLQDVVLLVPDPTEQNSPGSATPQDFGLRLLRPRGTFFCEDLRPGKIRFLGYRTPPTKGQKIRENRASTETPRKFVLQGLRHQKNVVREVSYPVGVCPGGLRPAGIFYTPWTHLKEDFFVKEQKKTIILSCWYGWTVLPKLNYPCFTGLLAFFFL